MIRKGVPVRILNTHNTYYSCIGHVVGHQREPQSFWRNLVEIDFPDYHFESETYGDTELQVVSITTIHDMGDIPERNQQAVEYNRQQKKDVL